MSRRYSIYDSATASAAQTILGLAGATSQEGHVYELIVGSQATPADQAINYKLAASAGIATGSGASLVPEPLSIGGIAAQSNGKITYASEPTYSGNPLLRFSINQQATFRWVTASDEGIVLSASATAGVGIQVTSVTGGSPTVEANIHFAE